VKVVFVQSKSKREADNIAAQCISERLAVAARVFAKTTPHLDIDAFGRDRQQEFVVVMKPNGDMADWLGSGAEDWLEERVYMLHGEELPKVLAIDVSENDPLYSGWGELIADMPNEVLLRSIAQNKEFRLIELEAQQEFKGLMNQKYGEQTKRWVKEILDNPDIVFRRAKSPDKF